MRQRLHFFRGVLAALLVVVLAGGVAAQTGRVGGVVKDEAGNPIKGATVTARLSEDGIKVCDPKRAGEDESEVFQRRFQPFQRFSRCQGG